MDRRGEARRTVFRPKDKLSDAGRFLRGWAGKPLQMGSVTPSGRALSRAMANFVDPHGQGPVIEIGPGTGPVTQALVERGVAEERLVLVEYSPEFCELLRRRFPKAKVVHGDAYALTRTLDGALSDKASAIVSCLPLLTKPEGIRLDLLTQAFELMQANGPFVQFTYSLASPIPLKHAFFTWKASPRIWRNVPPARVWAYRPLPKN